MRWLLVVMAALLVAGCFDGGRDDADTGGGPSGGSWKADEVPPGCDALRPVVAHTFGGVPRAAPGMRAPVACAHPTGRPGGEPTIGVSADGTVWVYPTSGAVDADPITNGRGPAYSRDGGATWDRSLIDVAGTGLTVQRLSLDPYLFLDPTTGRIFIDDIDAVACSQLSWTDDEGATWQGHVQSGCLVTDHQSVFTGPPVSSPTAGYPNIVYRCALSGGALADTSSAVACQRSLTGGLTWMPPGRPAYTWTPMAAGDLGAEGACYSGPGHGITDPADGRIYWPGGLCGQPVIAISDDEGLTWTVAHPGDNGMNGRDGTAHDSSVAVDAEGTVYSFWVAADSLPYIAVSTDRGTSWSSPRMVGPPGLTGAAHPQVAAGGAGKLAWVYMGTFDDPASDDQDWFGVIGASWDFEAAQPTLWSGAVTNGTDRFVRGVCGAIRCSAGSGDFVDVRIAPDGTPWGVFTDDCKGPCESESGGATDSREVVAVRFFGGGSLWDAADANGPYP
ncbi:MAG TPA: sialidase family protein [Candidatus Thermoplasmatota archaeon]|nr:sialidase family protein [Candidatus Thermoplasmatota archaeon]